MSLSVQFAITKIPKNEQLNNNRHLFLIVLEAGKSQIEVPEDWCLVRARDLFEVSFIRALTPHNLITPQRPPPRNSINLGVRISIHEFGNGGTQTLSPYQAAFGAFTLPCPETKETHEQGLSSM